MYLLHKRTLIGIAAHVALLFLPPFSASAETKLDWDPEHTWVFAVGILEWEHSDIYPSFPAAMKDRRDKQLVEYFREAGVPDEQITYLQDAAATKGRIENEFRALLGQDRRRRPPHLLFCRPRFARRRLRRNLVRQLRRRRVGRQRLEHPQHFHGDRQPLQRQPRTAPGRLLPLRRALR